MLETMTDSFTITLSLTAHEWAKKFSCAQSISRKAKQVYLNTLAVMGVHNYLNCLGWQTSLVSSDSWNPLLQTMMDVADLDLPQYGKLECRYVLSDRDWVEIPAEVSSDRIGYVVLQFHESLRTAKLLGFVSQVDSNRIALTQLQSLESLPYHLTKLKQIEQTKLSSSTVGKETAFLSVPKSIVPQPVQLSKWLKNIFEIDWQPLQNLSIPDRRMAYRSLQQFQQQKRSLSGVSRFKILELTPLSKSDRLGTTVSVALILNISSNQELEKDISIKVYPLNHHTHLPQGLEILVLNERLIPIMQAQAHEAETIEFRLSGEEGEYFQIKASLNNCERVETFII